MRTISFPLGVLPVLPVQLDWSLSHHDKRFVLYVVLCATFPVGLPRNSILQLEGDRISYISYVISWTADHEMHQVGECSLVSQ